MRIVAARRGPDVLKCRISIPRIDGRLVVWCEVDRLQPSGLSVAELFDRLRPSLVAAIEDAAARDTGLPPASRPVSIGMDVGAVDPSILLEVRDPAACVMDMAGQLGQLQRIAERMIDGQRACVRRSR